MEGFQLQQVGFIKDMLEDLNASRCLIDFQNKGVKSRRKKKIHINGAISKSSGPQHPQNIIHIRSK